MIHDVKDTQAFKRAMMGEHRLNNINTVDELHVQVMSPDKEEELLGHIKSSSAYNLVDFLLEKDKITFRRRNDYEKLEENAYRLAHFTEPHRRYYISELVAFSPKEFEEFLVEYTNELLRELDHQVIYPPSFSKGMFRG